jgi:tetratricopeptide (TPR) repeat protein
LSHLGEISNHSLAVAAPLRAARASKRFDTGVRAAVVLLTLSVPALAQQADLGARMQTIAQSLGVSCGYCHSAERGSGQPEPKKDIARAMIAMTRDINSKIEAATGGTAAKVDCVTCHRGVAIPKQLSEILSMTLKERGADAAVEQYKDLHARYYGRASYDFGEATIIDLVRPIAARKPDDALALLNAQLEFNPKSARTLEAIAYAYTRKYDDATAIKYLEKAVEIEPENGQVRGQLEQLKSYRRKN